MTKKGISVVLAIACVLCVFGAVVAAGVWVASDEESTTITTGQSYVMTLDQLSASNNQGMYPGDTAEITLTADNDNYKATLTVELQCAALDGTLSTWKEHFKVKYQIDSAESATDYEGGISLEAKDGSYNVKITIELLDGAPATMANSSITVLIKLDKAAD